MGIVPATYGQVGNTPAIQQGGITQSELQTAMDKMATTLRDEREGVLINSGSDNQVVQNLNAGRTDDQAIDDISFSVAGVTRTDMMPYDNFLVTISEGTSTIADSAVFAFSFEDWDELKEVPVPSQSSLVDAYINDNRALRWAWHSETPSVTIATSFRNAKTTVPALQEDVVDLYNAIRQSVRVVYIGKSVAVAENPQKMLVAVSGYKQNFTIKVRGLRGSSSSN